MHQARSKKLRTAPSLILLDRDGVLNIDLPKGVQHPEDFKPIKGAAQAVAQLNAAGSKIALVTNQSVIGRGIIDMAILQTIHDKMHQELARAGAWLDAIYICPDPPWAASNRRKPAPGMLEEALHDFGAQPAVTPLIGDTLQDLQAAAKLGCPRHLVCTGKGQALLADGIPAEIQPVQIHMDLSAAVAVLLQTRHAEYALSNLDEKPT